MAGKILRLKDLIDHTGLSRSVIYDRMNEKSPRYAKDFPKSFSLDGGAIGWFQSEVDEWLQSCAANAKSGTKARSSKPSIDQRQTKIDEPETPRTTPGTATRSEKPQSNKKPLVSESTPRQPTRPGNLAEAIMQGGRINARIQYFLQMKEWTPAMGALLVSGVEPSLDCNDIPNNATGIDGVVLDFKCKDSGRLYEAGRILRDWYEWKEDSGDPAIMMEPTRFLQWCRDECLDNEWLRLTLEVAGMIDMSAVDLTAARFALLTNR